MIKEDIACRRYFRFKNDFVVLGITSMINRHDGAEMAEHNSSMALPITPDEIN